MRRMRRGVAVLVAASCAGSGAGAQARVTFDIDYALDAAANNFFNPGTANGLAARAALAAAADVYSDRLLDNLSAIAPSGGNIWSPTMRHPVTGMSNVSAPVTSVPANTLKVFTAGRLEGGSLATGGFGGFSTASGTQTFINTLFRGQSGAQNPPQTDFGSWGGSMSFDTTFNWNYNVLSGPAFSQFDFYSVALHELGHLLGSGTAQSYKSTLSSGLTFNGPKSMALNGGLPVPLANTGHLDGSLTSPLAAGGTAQQPAMTPSITNGQRKLLTLLDWAGLDDLGWDLARPGDANADGTVNFPDLLLLAKNYNASGQTWSEGDFDYSGTVSFPDLLALAKNYNSSGPLAGEIAGAALAGGDAFAAEVSAAFAVVPEPLCGSFLLGASLMLGRRRRSA